MKGPAPSSCGLYRMNNAELVSVLSKSGWGIRKLCNNNKKSTNQLTYVQVHK